ncbi:hypothetical protein GCM10009416_40860 [Craurococcus roseus]|uniref:Uncharacterized protein n=1 Tax=Craurococcus roseus TaxID=77585 RepID=A0ABP3R2S4_9PROT
MIAALLVSAQPVAVKSAAGMRCHGAAALPQPATPSAAAAIPARVTATGPKRASRDGSHAVGAALARDCKVIAAEISDSGHPSRACRACRYTEGP